MNNEVSQLSPVVRERDEGPRHNVLGAQHLYKVLAAETGGSLSACEATVPPGVGAPPHTHAHEDEAFYIVEGEMVFEIEGRNLPLRLGPGSFAFAPRGSRHAFRNESTAPARMLALSLPGTGLERMFAAYDKAMRTSAGGLPPVEQIVAIAAAKGVTIEPPPA
jgi:mannose-6-phosphate isomerase-like protein (cupin superfamily)